MARPRRTPSTPFGLWLDGWLRDHEKDWTFQRFADEVGVTKSAVSLWVSTAKRIRIPIQRLREVSRVTGEPVANLEMMVYGDQVPPASAAVPLFSLTAEQLEEMMEGAAQRAVAKVLGKA